MIIHSGKNLRNWVKEHTRNWSEEDINIVMKGLMEHPDRPRWGTDWDEYLESFPPLESFLEVEKDYRK